MKPVLRHKYPISAARLLSLMVMAILLASPVLAAVSASLACGGRFCCCTAAGEEAAVTIRGSVFPQAGFCNTAEATPCRMSAGSLPDTPPAWIHSPTRLVADPIHPLPGNHLPAVDRWRFNIPCSRVDIVLALPEPPLYLRTCRLIC